MNLEIFGDRIVDLQNQNLTKQYNAFFKSQDTKAKLKAAETKAKQLGPKLKIEYSTLLKQIEEAQNRVTELNKLCGNYLTTGISRHNWFLCGEDYSKAEFNLKQYIKNSVSNKRDKLAEDAKLKEELTYKEEKELKKQAHLDAVLFYGTGMTIDELYKKLQEKYVK